MSDPFKQNGAFSWCELMTPDAEASKRFYRELIGWQTEDLVMEGMTYTVLKAGDQEVGGIMAVPPQATGMPPAWGSYVTVEDVDATAAKAAHLGATILVPPTDIPEVGRFCTFRDPQGAVLSVITYLPRS